MTRRAFNRNRRKYNRLRRRLLGGLFSIRLRHWDELPAKPRTLKDMRIAIAPA